MVNESRQTRAEYIIQQINVNNAKKVAFLLVIAFIIYHGLIHLRYGTDSCKWLLTKGRFKGNKEWQPYGCMMHKYSQIDTRRCFRYLAFWGKDNYFIFIGDKRMYSLYSAFVRYFQNDFEIDDESIKLDKDKQYFDNKLKLRVNFYYHNEISDKLVEQINEFTTTSSPSAIIIGCTYKKFLKGNLTKSILNSYYKNLTKIIHPLENLIYKKKTKILWKLHDPIGYENLPDDWKNITNDDIDQLNYVASDAFAYSKIKLWSSSHLIASELIGDMKNGIDLSPISLRHTVQILLNMYCNDYMNYNDGTCCSSAEGYTILQIVTFSMFGICMILAVVILIRRWYLKFQIGTMYTLLNTNLNNATNGISDITTPIFALANLGLILGYFYLCDRTNFFMKENKYYSEFSFWIPVGYVFALGLFFTEDSRFTKVLHRDQTDELKGWMQLCILIYHITGADRVLPIYMHIKVLISAYLFLSGYGHFTHMWQTGNASLLRFFEVMFRINFTTILLCLCMNRPYQFYYYVPLLSYWFCIIYLVLSLPPHITSQNCEHNSYQYLYLVIKFISLLSVITILYMSEVLFERIFVTRPWKALFVSTDDDIREWWYRWKLDRYSITYGMIFGAILHISQKFGIVDDNNHSNLFSRQISLTVTLISIIGVGFYTTFSFLCRSRQNCEEIHSYVVFIPIIGYIILRNISGILRTRYSTFFAWFGKISLELFICQCHIWLAADHHGVLVLLPGFPTLNVLITSFIFVCTSHEIHRLTMLLIPWVVPNDLKLTLRNFILFLCILFPIGRYDGMF